MHVEQIMAKFFPKQENRDPYDLIPADIELFLGSICGKRESEVEFSNLEIKSDLPSGDNSISAHIGSMCNGDGGLIVIGGPRLNKGVFDSTYSGTDADRDKVVDIYSKQLNPVPHGIKIQQVPYKGKKILAIFVPTSEYPPIRSETGGDKGIYYFRTDKGKQPASHSLIETLFSKRTGPALEIDNPQIIEYVHVVPDDIDANEKFRITLKFGIRNFGRGISQYPFVAIEPTLKNTLLSGIDPERFGNFDNDHKIIMRAGLDRLIIYPNDIRTFEDRVAFIFNWGTFPQKNDAGPLRFKFYLSSKDMPTRIFVSNEINLDELTSIDAKTGTYIDLVLRPEMLDTSGA